MSNFELHTKHHRARTNSTRTQHGIKLNIYYCRPVVTSQQSPLCWAASNAGSATVLQNHCQWCKKKKSHPSYAGYRAAFKTPWTLKSSIACYFTNQLRSLKLKLIIIWKRQKGRRVLNVCGWKMTEANDFLNNFAPCHTKLFGFTTPLMTIWVKKDQRVLTI